LKSLSKHKYFAAAWLISILMMAGCIGEDYYEDPPTAHLEIGDKKYKLKEGNRNWRFTDEDLNKEHIDLKELAAKQKEITVKPGGRALLVYEQNGKDGRYIYTGQKIGVVARKGDEIQILSEQAGGFYFPKEKGNYVLEIDFDSGQGDTEFVGNIKVE
jgi:hypothetical protein